MSFGDWNAVRGCPGWYYGLLLREGEHRVTFEVTGPEGRSIEGLVASGYRTTTLARKMGERVLKGYQHVAQEAIRAANTHREQS